MLSLQPSGAVLEDCERLERQAQDGMAPDMDNIFAMLKGCSRQHTLSKSSRDMIYSVVELRGNNWGRSEPAPEPNNAGYGMPMAAPNNYAVNGALVQAGPIFYGANGMQISAQEAGYMSEVDYIQQLQWGNEAGGAGDPGAGYQNYNGAGRGRGRNAGGGGGGVGGNGGGIGGLEESVGGGYSRAHQIINQSQGGYANPYENYEGNYEGADPYEIANAALPDIWSTINEEMTDDMIEAFEQFVLENNMGVPTDQNGPVGYGNGL